MRGLATYQDGWAALSNTGLTGPGNPAATVWVGHRRYTRLSLTSENPAPATVVVGWHRTLDDAVSSFAPIATRRIAVPGNGHGVWTFPNVGPWLRRDPIAGAPQFAPFLEYSPTDDDGRLFFTEASELVHVEAVSIAAGAALDTYLPAYEGPAQLWTNLPAPATAIVKRLLGDGVTERFVAELTTFGDAITRLHIPGDDAVFLRLRNTAAAPAIFSAVLTAANI